MNFPVFTYKSQNFAQSQQNFAQENGQKISKHPHKMGKNGRKNIKKINKIMNFPACTYKSQNFAQSQQNCVPSHDGEKVTFRNSGYSLPCPAGSMSSSGQVSQEQARQAIQWTLTMYSK